ncbi:UNVERIFIED_CONTAM: hypothetical protein RMT77_018264 [Armadillidium vulgare]
MEIIKLGKEMGLKGKELIDFFKEFQTRAEARAEAEKARAEAEKARAEARAKAAKQRELEYRLLKIQLGLVSESDENIDELVEGKKYLEKNSFSQPEIFVEREASASQDSSVLPYHEVIEVASPSDTTAISKIISTTAATSEECSLVPASTSVNSNDEVFIEKKDFEKIASELIKNNESKKKETPVFKIENNKLKETTCERLQQLTPPLVTQKIEFPTKAITERSNDVRSNNDASKLMLIQQTDNSQVVSQYEKNQRLMELQKSALEDEELVQIKQDEFEQQLHVSKKVEEYFHTKTRLIRDRTKILESVVETANSNKKNAEEQSQEYRGIIKASQSSSSKDEQKSEDLDKRYVKIQKNNNRVMRDERKFNINVNPKYEENYISNFTEEIVKIQIEEEESTQDFNVTSVPKSMYQNENSEVESESYIIPSSSLSSPSSFSSNPSPSHPGDGKEIAIKRKKRRKRRCNLRMRQKNADNNDNEKSVKPLFALYMKNTVEELYCREDTLVKRGRNLEDNRIIIQSMGKLLGNIITDKGTLSKDFQYKFNVGLQNLVELNLKDFEVEGIKRILSYECDERMKKTNFNFRIQELRRYKYRRKGKIIIK